MTDRPAPPAPKKPVAPSDKAARQAAALRANLARRKAQKRARADAPGSQEQG